MSQNLTVRLKPDEDGDWIAAVDELPGVVEQGYTIERALENIGRAIQFELMAEGEGR